MYQHEPNYRPRLLLGYADSGHAARVGRHFRRLGWEVRLAATAAEAYRLAMEFAPRVILLDTELPDESGWLTCAKITLEHPEQRVLLLTPELNAADKQRLASVGAEDLVSRQDSIEHLAEAILGERLAEAV